MSLILDALRKSEAERRRGNLPALALELPPSAPLATRTRAWWLAFPIAVAVGAVAFWLARPDEPATPAVPPAAAAREQRVQPLDSPPVDARSAEARPAEDATQAPANPSPPAPSPLPEAETLPAPGPANPPAPTAPSAPILALADLTPDERRALPPLKLSMHMWSPAPASRFVILDGHRLAEGDRVGNAVVERIDPDGVILAADGRRIRLPLP